MFITFEGGEGCGKSYQSKNLYRRFARLGMPAILTFEPGGTVLGNNIRKILKSNHQSISGKTELLLFNACRVELVNNVIIPNLQKGIHVICDRFTDSTIAYQGYGRGLPIDLVKSVNDIATGKARPDLTILLDMPVEDGLNRKVNKASDRFDSEEMVFHNRVRSGFIKLAKAEPKRWYTINAGLRRAEISRLIWEKVSSLL
jgi:dTMP kinase